MFVVVVALALDDLVFNVPLSTYYMPVEPIFSLIEREQYRINWIDSLHRVQNVKKNNRKQWNSSALFLSLVLFTTQ